VQWRTLGIWESWSRGREREELGRAKQVRGGEERSGIVRGVPEEERREEERDIGGRHLCGRNVVGMRQRLQKSKHVQQHLITHTTQPFLALNNAIKIYYLLFKFKIKIIIIINWW
jgi:hypothetical protein